MAGAPAGAVRRRFGGGARAQGSECEYQCRGLERKYTGRDSEVASRKQKVHGAGLGGSADAPLYQRASFNLLRFCGALVLFMAVRHLYLTIKSVCVAWPPRTPASAAFDKRE